MGEQMEFPITFEDFAEEYGIKDYKEIYTNGDDLIPIFRVKQWLEHDNKLRKIETDTAYECGKHANKWIPISSGRLPDAGEEVIATRQLNFWDQDEPSYDVRVLLYAGVIDEGPMFRTRNGEYLSDVTAWMPKPEPYRMESEDRT